MKSIHMRVAYEFKKLVYKIRARYMLIKGKDISCEEVTKRFLKYLEEENIWRDEFDSK